MDMVLLTAVGVGGVIVSALQQREDGILRDAAAAAVDQIGQQKPDFFRAVIGVGDDLFAGTNGEFAQHGNMEFLHVQTLPS